MTEHNIRKAFLDVYDRCADDIFAYCYERTAHREIARYMTRTIFIKTWDLLRSSGSRVTNISLALRRTMRDHMSGFARIKHPISSTEKLWNLTLSQ